MGQANDNIFSTMSFFDLELKFFLLLQNNNN